MSEGATFIARVEKGFRVFIPRAAREVLELQEGDYVEVQIRRVRKGGKFTRSVRA
jgi:AbrB family looped-hinge helix DNA binding protein